MLESLRKKNIVASPITDLDTDPEL